MAGAKGKGLLRRAVAANVQVCIVDTLTGPTSEISHIILHRCGAQAADQHKGIQNDPHRFYVGLTRAQRSTTVWLEKEPFGMPGSRAGRVSRSTRAADANAQAFFNKMFDAIGGLAIPNEDMDWGSEEMLPRVALSVGPVTTGGLASSTGRPAARGGGPQPLNPRPARGIT